MIRFIHPAPVSSGGIVKAMFVPQQMPGWEPGKIKPFQARIAVLSRPSISTRGSDCLF
jgi:hypothetical protein